jgi:integrase
MLAPKRRPKSPFWILRGTVDGKRVEVSRKWSTAAEARRAIPEVLAELSRPDSADPVVERPYTVGDAIRLYREINPDARFLDPVERYFDTVPVSDMNNADMRRAANVLYPGRSPATIRRQLYTPVKAALNVAAGDDLCAVPKLKSPTEGGKRTHFFVPAAAEAIIAHLAGESNRFLAPLVTFLIGQGCRMGETLTMDGTDVHLDLKIAILRDTKNDEERRVTLVPRVVAALSNLPTLGRPGALFRRLDGMPFREGQDNGGQIALPFRRAVKAAALDPDHITPHVCRHSWATWFYAQTRDVLRLKDEGGWKSGEWQRYTKLGTPELGSAALKYGWDFGLPGENRGHPALGIAKTGT